jgi:FAD/FMN-containing dehydrogenase
MRTFARGEAGYEEARRGSSFNARLPDRFPEVIVQAEDVYDVVAAVKRAKRDGMRVTVKSGGHSWAANHLRDGGVLIDLSWLDEVRVDGKRAAVGPGKSGHELAIELGKKGLFFPAGHCPGVCLGGYLLQGGFGWHSRTLGPACASLEAIDVVTADGDLVRASAEENADLYWSARGAGPGFFGIVTRFHLRLYPRPKVVGMALQTYPLDRLDDVFRWAHAVGHDVPASIELQLMITHEGIMVYAPILADSLRQAWRDLRFMREHALRPSRNIPFAPTGLRLMYRGVKQHYPDDHRYAVDNMWTHAPIESLLPGLHRIAETMPPAPSHVLWLNWVPPRERPDMAFSMEDDHYLALYAVWKDAADDARYAAWPALRMREMEPLASGCQLADENLGQRPSRFASDRNLARLDELRAARDPEGRFFPWMGRPSSSTARRSSCPSVSCSRGPALARSRARSCRRGPTAGNTSVRAWRDRSSASSGRPTTAPGVFRPRAASRWSWACRWTIPTTRAPSRPPVRASSSGT